MVPNSLGSSPRINILPHAGKEGSGPTYLTRRGGWTRSCELNRLRAPPMRLYGELVSLLLRPEYSRLRQGSVALIVINRNIIRTRLNP